MHIKPVSIVMGSDSDLSVMRQAQESLVLLGIQSELSIVSAHRTPLKMVDYATSLYDRGIKVVIAGAGGAAHLPGMIASLTILPVIGVPVRSAGSLDGFDSILSILQMPPGVPVATMALNGAFNAGILAAQILALSDLLIAKNLLDYKESLRQKVAAMVANLTVEP